MIRFSGENDSTEKVFSAIDYRRRKEANVSDREAISLSFLLKSATPGSASLSAAWIISAVKIGLPVEGSELTWVRSRSFDMLAPRQVLAIL